jgi:hypothetical protein
LCTFRGNERKELAKIQRYFKSDKGEYGDGDVFMGVRMGDVFNLAKEFMEMPPDEVETLLEISIHEVRAGGMSVMDKQARHKKTVTSRRKELFNLYLRRHDLNNWDLVDLGAIHMIGEYLFDKPRDILYRLARSENLWERRTAIVATAFFTKQKDTEDTFTIAELLLNDKEDLIHKVVGGWLRAAGGEPLVAFLDQHAAVMPRTMLRYAIEHLDKAQRDII